MLWRCIECQPVEGIFGVLKVVFACAVGTSFKCEMFVSDKQQYVVGKVYKFPFASEFEAD